MTPPSKAHHNRIEKLIGSDGKPALGHFDYVIDHINPEDADYRTPLNKPASNLKKYFDFNRFQYVGGVSDSVIFGCAMADVRYVGSVFVYVYDVSCKELKTWVVKTPFALGMNLSNRQDNKVSHFKRGSKSATISYELDDSGVRRKRLQVDFGSELRIDAVMTEDTDYVCKSLCIPSSINGWVYAQKTAALPVTGSIESPLGNFSLRETNCYGHTDYSAGFMRRETFWNWACFSGHNGQNRLGLNVSWGVNETGYSENCLWVNDSVVSLPQVQFQFDRDDDNSRWKITSADGRVNLDFVPMGMYHDRVNALFLANYFKQIFGEFKGTVTDEQGTAHRVDGLYGFVEDQYAKW